MKKYPTETVRLFVEDALSVTRSPGKIEVYKAWLNEHPKPEALIPRIWAETLANWLKDSNELREMYRDLPPLEWNYVEYGGLVGDKMNIPHPEPETRAFYHQFTDNPEQPSGITEIVFDEAMELPQCSKCDGECTCHGPWISPDDGGLTFYKPEGD